jgi:hypothetical protein
VYNSHGFTLHGTPMPSQPMLLGGGDSMDDAMPNDKSGMLTSDQLRQQAALRKDNGNNGDPKQ